VVVVLARHVLHERAVDLDFFDGEPPQVGERGIARAEVVDAERHAHSGELPEYFQGGGRVDHDRGLGDLELEVGGAEAGLVERRGDGLHELTVEQRAGRHVDGDLQLQSVRAPRGALAQRTSEHVVGQRLDQPGVLGHLDKGAGLE
jgi:hypothetical protein